MFCWPALEFADAADLIQQGTQAIDKKDLQSAERALSKAMELEPNNYRVMELLAVVKAQLRKYDEAEKLAIQILAMPIGKGRNVLVHMEGGSQPLEAELIDERVMASPQIEDLMGKFIKKPVSPEPILHYRLYFKKIEKIF